MKPFYFITLFAVLGMGMTTLQAQTTTVTCPEITDISCYHKDARGYECTTKNEKWTSIGHYPAQPYLMRFIGLASYPDPQNPKKRIVTGCTYRTTGKTLTLA